MDTFGQKFVFLFLVLFIYVPVKDVIIIIDIILPPFKHSNIH